MKKLKVIDMELSLSTYLNARTNLIVPNVHWGIDIHECDLLVITPSGYAWEVEIKTSKADLLKDKEKSHGHIDPQGRIKHLYFALPDYLEEHIMHIPHHAGIIVVNSEHGHCKTIRKPGIMGKYKWSDKERFMVARLGALRIWRLKKKIRDKDKDLADLLAGKSGSKTG